jgi:hypothetical protein
MGHFDCDPPTSVPSGRRLVEPRTLAACFEMLANTSLCASARQRGNGVVP